MNNLTIDEIKASEIESLLLLRDFCEKYNLKYYLTFGTLLGAVRHKGFIPWDDDIDVFLPRRDYNFLLENFNEWNKAKERKREVISKELDPQFYCNYAKIIDRNTSVIEKGQTLEIGIWVDLFPMDEISSFPLLFKVKVDFCDKILSYSDVKVRKGRKWYKNLIIRLFHAVTPSDKTIQRYRLHLIHKTQHEGGNNYALLYRNFGKIGVPILPKSMFVPAVKLLFEEELFSVPKEYDEFLRACYGDYNVIPPIEEQISHHRFTCVQKKGNITVKKVITFGVFDYFHIGHLNLIEQARSLGDFLIVAVQEEDSILKYKPDADIYYSTTERMRFVNALKNVDSVVTYRDVDVDIKSIDFDIFAIGEDQTHAGFQRAIEWCMDHNKEITRLKYTHGISSFDIKKKV